MASVRDACLGQVSEAKVINLVHKMNQIEFSEEKKLRCIFCGT